MSDISLLPEDLRKKEAQIQKPPPPPAAAADLRFSMPTDQEEDIEIIEVDEGELDQVLASEPPLSRLAFKLQSFVQSALAKLHQPKAMEAPPKLPPQFFKPPAAKAGAPAPAAPGVAAPLSASVPQEITSKSVVDSIVKQKLSTGATLQPGKRVRVIKRVRKPVNVSFVSNEALLMARIDVSKRRFTFLSTLAVFLLLFGASYAYLAGSRRATSDNLATLKGQLTEVQSKITERQKTWKAFKDLEPHLKALNDLLDVHISPTQLLASIEAVTLPKVSYGAMNLTEDGKVSLGVRADTFETAAKQVVAYKRADFVKKVDVSSYSATYDDTDRVSLVPSEVAFQLSLVLAPNALHAAEKPAAVTAYAR